MKRLRYALIALVFAIVLLIARPVVADDCFPLCPLYAPWSFLWVWHSCWTCPPPPPEG